MWSNEPLDSVRMNRRARVTLTSLSLLFLCSGCAHYYWPTSQLESPEATSPDRIGRLEILSIQSGSDLMALPSTQPKDPTTGVTPDPQLAMTPLSFGFGFVTGITRELEVGVRIQPFAPMLARVKYQLLGPPEGQSANGDFALAANASGGLLLATYAGSAVTFYTANGALLAGIRFGTHHLASLAPFFSLAGLSGTGASAGSGTKFGASLGYQYDSEALILRAELTWASGSYTQASTGPTQAGGIFPGALFGLKL